MSDERTPMYWPYFRGRRPYYYNEPIIITQHIPRCPYNCDMANRRYQNLPRITAYDKYRQSDKVGTYRTAKRTIVAKKTFSRKAKAADRKNSLRKRIIKKSVKMLKQAGRQKPKKTNNCKRNKPLKKSVFSQTENDLRLAAYAKQLRKYQPKMAPSKPAKKAVPPKSQLTSIGNMLRKSISKFCSLWSSSTNVKSGSSSDWDAYKSPKRVRFQGIDSSNSSDDQQANSRSSSSSSDESVRLPMGSYDSDSGDNWHGNVRNEIGNRVIRTDSYAKNALTSATATSLALSSTLATACASTSTSSEDDANVSTETAENS